jgi:hypothetical protein
LKPKSQHQTLKVEYTVEPSGDSKHAPDKVHSRILDDIQASFGGIAEDEGFAKMTFGKCISCGPEARDFGEEREIDPAELNITEPRDILGGA